MIDTMFAIGLAFDLFRWFLIVFSKAGLEPELDVDVLCIDLF
jgi:hypothetical protein